MLCNNCNGFNLTKILSKNLPNGTVYEEWKCYTCGLINSNTIPNTVTAVTIPIVPETRQEKVNAVWDECQKAVDRLPDLEKWMMYSYMNKIGISIIGLDYKIEKELRQKFPEEKKKTF